MDFTEPVWTLLERHISSGDAAVQDVLRECAELHDFSVHDRHVVREAGGVAEAVCAADLQRLPDGGHAECLARVEGRVEIRLLDRVECLDVFLRRMAGLFAREVKADDAVMAEIHGEFRGFERIGAVAHRADDEAPFHAEFFLPAPQPVEDRADDGFIGEAAFAMEAWCEARLGIDHAVAVHVLDEFKGDAIERVARLHHGTGVREAFEVERQ